MFDQSTRKLRQLAAEKPRIAEAFEARMSRGEQPGWYAALVHELNSYGAKSDRAEPKTLTQKIASDLGVDQALPIQSLCDTGCADKRSNCTTLPMDNPRMLSEQDERLARCV